MWGTCLGFEVMIYYESKYKIKTSHPTSLNERYQIKFIRDKFNKSAFKEIMSPNSAKHLEDEAASYFNHHYGFELNDFYKSEDLKKAFNVVAYYQKKSKDYVAIVQHKKYPIYGVQFHPEKILFEHKRRLDLRLTLNSSIASQEMSRILFAPTLRNVNMFPSQRMLGHFLLDNFASVKTYGTFASIYLFNANFFKEEKFKLVLRNKVKHLRAWI